MTRESDHRARLDLAERIKDDAVILVSFLQRHGDAESPEVVRDVGAAISHLIDYGKALTEGRVQLKQTKRAPALAILDGGKPED